MTNYTLKYVNEYLLNCVTRQEDMLAYIDSTWEDVEVVDILGTTEDEGRIHIELEVVYNDCAYVEHISFMNMWDYIYKNEMVEISDMIGVKLGEQLEFLQMEKIKINMDKSTHSENEINELMNLHSSHGSFKEVNGELIENESIDDLLDAYQYETDIFVFETMDVERFKNSLEYLKIYEI